MRIPLATDYKTRTGAPDKDARQKNSYIEVKNDQAIVRKRPSAQGGIAVGTGVAQGGIGLNINGVPYFIGFWADTMQPYSGSGTSWDAGTAYGVGAHVTVDFEDYYATPDAEIYPGNIGKNPRTNPQYWSPSFVPKLPTRIRGAFPTGGYNWTNGLYYSPQIVPDDGVHPIAAILNITSTASGVTTTISSSSYLGTSPTRAEFDTATYSYQSYGQTPPYPNVLSVSSQPVSVIAGINQNLPSSVIYDFGAVVNAITALGDALFAAQ